MWNQPRSSARSRLGIVLGHLTSVDTATDSSCTDLRALPCTSTRLRIEPVAGCTLGAVVHGVSVSNLDEETFKLVENALHEHAVLIFRGQYDLTKEQQVNFGRRFGALTEFEYTPISNLNEKGQFLSPEDPWFNTIRINEHWHVDLTYTPVQNKAGMMYAVGPLPSAGGGTEFADMRAAYDVLEESQKTKIEKLSAYHSVLYSYATLTNWFPAFSAMPSYGGSATAAEKNVDPTAEQNAVPTNTASLRPLVKVHPVTGRKSILVSSHAFGIPDMTREDSQQFLKSLCDFACQAPRVYEHHWQVGDVVIWDNRCCLHRARPYDSKEKRVLRGTFIAGEKDTEGDIPAPDAAKVLAAELDRLKSQSPSQSSASR